MSLIIILFGVLTLLAGISIFLKPEIIFGYLNKHVDKVELYVLAIAVRLVLGVLLISQSEVSRFPLVIEVVGWLSIVAAVFFTAVGRNKFLWIMSWALSLAEPFVRAGGIVAVGFGAFLIYAFV